MLFEFYLNSVKCILSETKCIWNAYFGIILMNVLEHWLSDVVGAGAKLSLEKIGLWFSDTWKKKFPQTWDQWYTFKSLQVLSEENLNWNLTRNPWKKEEEMVGFLGGKEYSSLVMYKEECKAVVLFANFT